MPTVNVDVTSTWTKVAADTADPVTIQCSAEVEWYVASVATDVAPTVVGHRLIGSSHAINRADVGTGFVYAKIVGPSKAVFVVST